MNAVFPDKAQGRHPGPSRPVILILGGAPDTGNLGVSALGESLVKGVRAAFPSARIILERHSRAPAAEVQSPDGKVVVEAMCLHPSARLRASCGTKRVGLLLRAADRMPRGLGAMLLRLNRTAAQLNDVDAVLDVSAGDSFASIYGAEVLARQVALKDFIIECGLPLVLPPQTFGPYHTEAARQQAGRIIGKSILAATREVSGREEAARELSADTAGRMVCRPDVAFLLDPVPVAPEAEPFATARHDDRALIGMNVSGLLFFGHSPAQPAVRYDHLMRRLARWALDKGDTRLLLVPHVIGKEPLPADRSQWDRLGECDTPACRMMLEELSAAYPGRVGCLSWPRTAGQTKYLVGRCDFFIGARMHSCIAAVSQGVPTVTLAYSKKAAGVMGHLPAAAEGVIDLRTTTAEACLERVEALYGRRGDLRAALEATVPGVRQSAEDFFRVDLAGALRRAGVLHE